MSTLRRSVKIGAGLIVVLYSLDFMLGLVPLGWVYFFPVVASVAAGAGLSLLYRFVLPAMTHSLYTLLTFAVGLALVIVNITPVGTLDPLYANHIHIAFVVVSLMLGNPRSRTHVRRTTRTGHL